MDMDCTDDAGLERLNELGPTAWNDLAGGGCHNVDGTDCRPQQRKTEECNDRCAYRARERQGRRLHHLQGRRQELRLIFSAANLFLWKLDDLLSRRHGYQPVEGATS